MPTHACGNVAVYIPTVNAQSYAPHIDAFLSYLGSESVIGNRSYSNSDLIAQTSSSCACNYFTACAVRLVDQGRKNDKATHTACRRATTVQ